jgi:O-antigen/teichoic acid export membrane protein
MPKFSINKIKDFISFGKDIIIMRIMFSIFSKADIFIAGKILGTKAIGYYSVAIELVSIPMDKFMPIINQVAFPAFSIVQTNKEDVKYYFLKTMRLSSAILFPIFWGFGIISFDIIQSIFGPKWNNIIGPLQMLCIIMPFRAIATLFAPMLNGIGNTKIPLFYTTLGCLIMPISFYFGCGYGLNGLAIAWVFGYIIVFLISSKLTITALKIKIGYLIKNVFYGMLASAIMVIFIFIVKKFSQKYFLSLLEIILTILFGAVIYIGILALINRNLIYESFDLLKVLKKK